ncbi:pituitary tumor-transforming gene 1 protein-interacting protein isoform X2 [Pangasianodon hypophthalmus]|uniref:pituitary tumor-transforming gene 1 protein-interacting protein isoform X2 n=1 Tax=Pangasianodon hypophthalmus TaxID=310915 RepID=UPI00147AD26A|nr:pituitary tumor-transforming gene 1 protein-interacting protein isoform X2 [Pangasianodon hypophthalmus]
MKKTKIIIKFLNFTGFLSSLCGVLVYVMFIQAANANANPSPAPVSQPCSSLSSCDSCLKNVSCLWCYTNDTCTVYPVAHLLPPASVCKLSQARWGVCSVNFEALIIAMAVLLGVLLLAVTVCCCCCCRRCGRSSRRAERRAKHDEIRKKYGLMSDSDHPYSKFENE